MIKIILIIVIIYLMIVYPEFRYFVFHPLQCVPAAYHDIRKYIKYKRWREMKTYGCMDVYIADEKQPFGSGKTLNMIRNALAIYNTYNDTTVYNFTSGEWVNQYVHIFSNIELRGVPYVPLVNTYQLIQVATADQDPDPDIHIYVFVIDELGRIFNNRDWKTNLNSDLLGAILQQRKNHLVILGTVQDYSLFDATLRKLCTNVYSCTKHWRLLTLRHYYAHDLERANFNNDLVMCRGIYVRFASDWLYNSYDTKEVVSDLQKSIAAGQHLSNEEVLKLAENNQDTRTLTRVAKRFRKHVRG